MLKMSNGSSFDLGSYPKAEKRKNVRFESVTDCEEEYSNSSTAEFLSEEGANWNNLAEAFDCEDKSDDQGLMDELLSLCSWFDGKDPRNGDSDSEDSEDEDWLSSLRHFADSQKPSASFSTPGHESWTSSHASVSGLRLESLLRFDSKPVLIAKRRTLDSGLPSSTCESLASSQTYSQSTDENNLEDAFQGIVNDDNDVSRDGVLSCSNDGDDFWGDVEF